MIKKPMTKTFEILSLQIGYYRYAMHLTYWLDGRFILWRVSLFSFPDFNIFLRIPFPSTFCDRASKWVLSPR